ncbi:unnamed protein product [Zymoseptoria tritici ST99CH_3D7]|uniref:Uncharacterized protein n=1 Tax=Zymoseptoria tritici (strain ST99CH_3D7) TaxID=1276538 RepID=A0A1X7SA82_ZYMT9|nr:unnamed protein product [Zymoseptoria tritici ST99CH_3D7]
MHSPSFVQSFCVSRMPPPPPCPPLPPTHDALLALFVSLTVMSLLTIAAGMTDTNIREACFTRVHTLSASTRSHFHAATDFIMRIAALAMASLSAGFTSCKAAILRTLKPFIDFILQTAAPSIALLSAGLTTCKATLSQACAGVAKISTDFIDFKIALATGFFGTSYKTRQADATSVNRLDQIDSTHSSTTEKGGDTQEHKDDSEYTDANSEESNGWTVVAKRHEQTCVMCDSDKEE